MSLIVLPRGRWRWWRHLRLAILRHRRLASVIWRILVTSWRRWWWRCIAMRRALLLVILTLRKVWLLVMRRRWVLLWRRIMRRTMSPRIWCCRHWWMWRIRWHSRLSVTWCRVTSVSSMRLSLDLRLESWASSPTPTPMSASTTSAFTRPTMLMLTRLVISKMTSTLCRLLVRRSGSGIVSTSTLAVLSLRCGLGFIIRVHRFISFFVENVGRIRSLVPNALGHDVRRVLSCVERWLVHFRLHRNFALVRETHEVHRHENWTKHFIDAAQDGSIFKAEHTAFIKWLGAHIRLDSHHLARLADIQNRTAARNRAIRRELNLRLANGETRHFIDRFQWTRRFLFFLFHRSFDLCAESTTVLFLVFVRTVAIRTRNVVHLTTELFIFFRLVVLLHISPSCGLDSAIRHRDSRRRRRLGGIHHGG